jgi:hypothetical protein
MNAAELSLPVDDRHATRQRVPEWRAQLSRHLAAVIRSAPGRSDDTVTFLVLTELQRLCPALDGAELMALYAEIKPDLVESGRAEPH